MSIFLSCTRLGELAIRARALAVAIAAATFAAVVTPSALAETITFDDLGVAVGTQLNPPAGVGVVSNGFTYDPGPDNSSGFNDLHITNGGSLPPSNGTASGGSHDDVILAKQGGGTFSIHSFDYAGFGIEVDFSAVGNLSGGGQLFASFSPDHVNDFDGPLVDFETFLFGAEWTNLESVVWRHPGGNDGIFFLDNIVVDQASSVPEPMMLSLLGVATAGFLARRRLSQR